MPDFLIAVRLEPAPKGRLPAWNGLLDVSDEHGLWSFSIGEGKLRPLPDGMLWGAFPDAAAALAALDAALAGAGDLLGYPVRARSRMACAVDGGRKSIAEFPVAQAEALLYLVSQ